MPEGTNNKMPWVLWMLLLSGGLLLQYSLGPGIGPFVTQTLLISGMSLVYGFILVSSLLKGCTKSTVSDAHETASNTNGVSNQKISTKDDAFDDESEFHRLGDTNQTGDNWEFETLDIELTNNELVQEASERKRLYFLDNVKSFLTFLVVSHHVTCSFGIPNSWILIVGLHDNSFKPFAMLFVLMNQGFFMSLFFFISAYFVPSSYERHGKKKFLLEKAKRLWIPALCVTITFPLLILYSQWFVGEGLVYMPTSGHAWFLFWLLTLNLAYVHIHEKSNDDEPKEWALPGLFSRYFFYGTVICGVGMTIVLVLLKDQGTFASMPLATGSLVNDLLFFTAGIVAQRNGWLEANYLSTNIGLTGSMLTIMVVIESATMAYLFSKASEIPLCGLFALMVAGIYCIDMSLAVLRFFQTYLDYRTTWTKFFSDAAYTVYLIHPCIVVLVSSLWIHIYESLGFKLEWKELSSYTPIEGGGITLSLSWLCSNLLTHAIVWPLAWYIRKLPGLRQIL
jgi:glucan biosynthesis protein C